MRKKIAASYWVEEDELSFAAARGFGEGRNPIFVTRMLLCLPREDERSGGGRTTRA